MSIRQFKIDDNEPRSVQIIKTLMKMNHVTIKQMSELMELKHPSNLSMYFSSDLKFGRFEDMLDVLGYEIKVVPKNPEN